MLDEWRSESIKKGRWCQSVTECLPCICLKSRLNEFKEINDRAAIQIVQIIQVIRNRLIVLLEEKLLKVSMLISFLPVATNATDEYILITYILGTNSEKRLSITSGNVQLLILFLSYVEML